MFRPKSEAVQVGLESVLVPCRNGTNFGPSQQLYFNLPRNIGFANLKNARILTSIRLDPNDNGTAATASAPYIPDRMTGPAIFVDRCIIRSNGVILEEMNNYYLYSKLHNCASADDGIENKRARLEGCMKSNRIIDSPYHVPNQAVANGAQVTIAANNTIRTVDRQVEIPLLGGIFQNPKAFPLMAMPLEVELILRPAAECLNTLEGAGGSAGLPCVDQPQAGGPPAVPTAQAFVVVTPGAAAQWGPIGADGPNTLSTDPNSNIVACCPFKVGQLCRLTGNNANQSIAAAAVAGSAITAIEQNGADFRITFGINVLEAGAGAGNNATGIRIFQTDANGALLGNNPPSYQWNNPRMILPRVVPPPQFAQAMAKSIQKGKYAIDCLSYIDYMTAIPGAVTNSTNIIPADLSRVKAIICVPVDQSAANSLDSRNNNMGQFLSADNYQFQINNILSPSRRVSVAREAFNVPADQGAFGQTKAVPSYSIGSNLGAIHGFELEKALQAAGIPCRNLSFITKDSQQMGCWALGRTLGPYGTSTNLQGISSVLYLNYSAAGNLKLVHNFVSHIRTFEITPAGVVVRY
tara:strand:+ start:772 stop:2508 length:1737 start_codon:yes stop_codon:yes gene_type:complete